MRDLEDPVSSPYSTCRDAVCKSGFPDKEDKNQSTEHTGFK